MVLEISINGNAYQDIRIAGGKFVSGGYNGYIAALSYRSAWTGLSGGDATTPAYITTVVKLPNSANGQNVRLKWRMVCNNSNTTAGDAGVRIDDVMLTSNSYLCCSGTSTPTPTATPTATPRPTATPNPTATAAPTSTPTATATVSPTATPTPNTGAGSGVTVTSPSGDASVQFSDVSSAGSTSFTPIAPESAGPPPQGYFVLNNGPAYDITTTASYTPPIDVYIVVKSVNDPEVFAKLRLLHGENGVLVDRTISTDFDTRTVHGRVNSLSPFVIAQVTTHRLLNISTRMRVLAGENVLIGGFIITGSEAKTVLIRGLGPELPVDGQLADPVLELHKGAAVLAQNDNWRDTQEQEIKDTTVPPTNDLEAAIVMTLQPGSYTAILSGKDNGTGVGQVEVYDLSGAAASQLANISTRGFVDTGDNVMIGGVIVGGGVGGSVTHVLVRAIGPSLSNQGVAGALQDTTLELRDANGQLVAENDDWKETQEQAIKDTTVPPTDDRESAIVQTVSAGNYTAIVRGKGDTTGVGLVELYNLQ